MRCWPRWWHHCAGNWPRPWPVCAINPRQVARYRERHGTSGAESDKAGSHTMADMVPTDAHQLRPAGDGSSEAEAIKVAAARRAARVLPRCAGGLRRPLAAASWTSWRRDWRRR